MRKTLFAATALAGALALAACQSEQADQVEDAAEANAEMLDEAADAAPTEAMEDNLEAAADVAEEKGEENANALDDNGEIAPSETGVGDTQ
jgi:hypothetical protein